MGIGLNPHRFGSAFVRRKAGRIVTDFLEGINKDGRGGERVSQMIDRNIRMDTLVPKEKLQQYLDLAKQYSWAASMISDEDIVGMLPDWVIAAVRTKGIPGWNWLRVQLDWLRNVFSG